ncbi:hypothetical protein HME9302_00622 [Alteripontixanthobacter maritimus]|uniref:Uncharacterized protein n=1 Tax=Alteripontixanthobacter maritimus TaxID=2161824 RepID=A0A369Q3W4_9SPHN|nr:hypothetical protein [Alteripontixanthobacter maritimus]RDC59434.1 hypothetical protein HME9302_00622 [Alteripontixanthobacter maritimus]
MPDNRFFSSQLTRAVTLSVIAMVFFVALSGQLHSVPAPMGDAPAHGGLFQIVELA